MQKAIEEGLGIWYISGQHNKYMNNYPLHTRKGFTLIELLVVIAIIAVLGSIGAVAGQKAIRAGQKVKSLANATTIVSAMDQYYNDYSRFPDIAGSGAFVNPGDDDATVLDGTGDNSLLVEALVGDEDDPLINPRGTAYISGIDDSGGGKGGIDFARNTYAFTDRWDEPYQVFWDANYDDEIEDPFDQQNVVKRTVIVTNSLEGEDLTSRTLVNRRVQTWTSAN